MERVLVTGGAGFIGSHLVDRLIEDQEVVVLDDLSAGTIENIQHHMENDKFTFIKGSLTSEDDVNKALDGATTVFHFAAQPDVRLSVSDPMFDFRINMIGGMTLLEAMRKRDISRLVFASSGGTVYGESESFPTPEKTVFTPISNYGAAK
ncbi:MAG: SDR family NAD(P)-dependent oxidoreductase, partial [Candidatus Thorarchaeota archaeon]